MQKPDAGETKSLSTEREHRNNVNLSLQWNRWLLKSMGAWPCSNDVSDTRKCFNWLLNVICYGLISFLFVPCGFYLMLEVEDVYNKLKLFGPLSFCVMAYMKYYSLVFHGDDIRECIERIERDWRNVEHFEDRDIMVTNAIFGRRLVKVCTFFSFSGYVFYYIAIPISVGKVEAEDENLTFVPMAFPFSRILVDTRHSPTNEILFTTQLLAGVLIHGIAAAACSLVAAFAVHACGQLKVLMCWLRHVIDGRDDMCGNVDTRIMKIVSQHVRILRFLGLVEKALQQISLVEFSGCILGICLLGYYIIMEWDSEDLTASITYSVILMSYILNIFIFCYIGELVAETCTKVGEMSYMVDWYRLQGNKQLSFVLIIAMSNSSVKLTAGNMVDLSVSTFGGVVRTSVAFLNMLRALT